MAFNHNMIGETVMPNHESLVQHKIWKGEPDLLGMHHAIIRGVERTKEGLTVFTCIDPHGNIFDITSNLVRIQFKT